MSLLAYVRPDDWNLPLFLHVLGAFATVGALILAATYLVPAMRTGAVEQLRLGYRALLIGALPSFIVMRVAAEWIYDKEGLDELPEDPDWVGIGYIISDLGALLLVIATVIAGVGVRRALQTGAAGGTTEARGGRAAASIVGVLLILYVVAIWTMTTKPS